ncbi:MAG TPA: PCYCGC motif-containing (lipo)protein [Bacillus sp. (in: firmicutes)]|nr:PCYCGC motif-containing (lipo)protein [Bacillus sp. (in: firmicutes)]
MKFKLALTTMVAFSTIILGACGNNEEVHEEAGQEHAQHVTGDLREETASVDALPKFLAAKPDDMKVLYQAAAKHQELLENIPCYCGCGESAGHTSNYDCFVYDNKENGAVVWDDHGTRCGVCLEIAAESIVDYSEGKSIKEIRQTIDAKYKEGYAKPTPTPEV